MERVFTTEEFCTLDGLIWSGARILNSEGREEVAEKNKMVNHSQSSARLWVLLRLNVQNTHATTAAMSS